MASKILHWNIHIIYMMTPPTPHPILCKKKKIHTFEHVICHKQIKRLVFHCYSFV